MKFDLVRKLWVVLLVCIIPLGVITIFSYSLNRSEKQVIISASLKTSLTNPQIHWQYNGKEVCSSIDQQSAPALCSDGEGGAIIAWYDLRSGIDRDIYSQKIDSKGNILWNINGTEISTYDYDQGAPLICTDGYGGAIIAWVDERDILGDIYAQRINSDGNTLWTPNGTAICIDNNVQDHLQICSDMAGGAFFVWRDNRSGNDDIYGQRINGNGEVKWKVNGKSICNASNYQGFPNICYDGFGGAIIAWEDGRSGWDIYAQRINSDGNTLWTPNGIGICVGIPYEQPNPRVCSDGTGGAIIAWPDNRYVLTTGEDMFIDKVDANGTSQWSVNGKEICITSSYQYGPFLYSDEDGGVLISWSDIRGTTDWDVYAQKLNSTGDNLWTFDGTLICNASGSQKVSSIVSDGNGGLIITWEDERNGMTNKDIYAQRIDANGNTSWDLNGIAICISLGHQLDPHLINDGKGGVISVWTDQRNDAGDIYAQRIIYKSVPSGQPSISFGNCYISFIIMGIITTYLIINKFRSSKLNINSKS